MKRIAIYTLTHQRDKFIDAMLAEELRKFGYEVVIRGYIYGARESICYEKPDVIIHPMPGGEYKMDTIENCKKWGVEVIVRRGEAGMGGDQFNGLDENRRKLILGNWDYSPFVDLELVWGQEFANIIAEKGHMPAEKLKACGAFAFDPYFLPEAKKTEPTSDKSTILFATGFSTADSRPDYCETGLPEGSDYHKELHELHKKARGLWLEAISMLVQGYSDKFNFELKVRPGESVKVYQDLVSDKVKIHPEDAPSSVVLRSVDLLVHSGSTLAIEAHLLGIPSFNFSNVNPDPLLSKVSPAFGYYNELEFMLRRAIPGRSNIHDSIYRELQEHLYGPIDGKACKRAAQYIHDHLKGKTLHNTSPTNWPKDPKYLVEGGRVHLEKQEGDYRWSCPCCRNIYWAEEIGVYNCPYCNMKIERTITEPGSSVPSRTRVALGEQGGSVCK